MIVAGLQYDIAWEDPPANFRRVEELVEGALGSGGALVEARTVRRSAPAPPSAGIPAPASAPGAAAATASAETHASAETPASAEAPPYVEAFASPEAPERPHLLVLPEMFATGFSMNARAVAGYAAEIRAFLARLAQRTGAYVLGGYAEPGEPLDGETGFGNAAERGLAAGPDIAAGSGPAARPCGPAESGPAARPGGPAESGKAAQPCGTAESGNTAATGEPPGNPPLTGGPLPANACSIFAPDGRELLHFRKLHPFSLAREEEHYQPGSRLETVEIEGVRVTPLICYDLRFPEPFRAAAEGTDLFCVIANWPQKRREAWSALLKARAIENQAYVLGVNRVGRGGGEPHSGDSVLLDPLGRTVGRGPKAGTEGFVVGEVTAQVVERVRRRFGFLRDRRPELYRRLEEERKEAKGDGGRRN